MPFKTTPIIVTTLKLGGNININDVDLQVVIIGRLQEIVNQLTGNGQVLENKIIKIRILQVKILLVKNFIGEKVKLKGFLIQIKLKI